MFGLGAFGLGIVLLPAMAQAQSVPDTGGNPSAAQDRNLFAHDYLIVGVGAANLPSYDSARGYKLNPAAGIMGKIHGVGITARSAGIALDFIDDHPGQKLSWQLGPVLRWRGGRPTKVEDPQVQRVGGVKGNIEAGINAGVGIHRVLDRYDTLSLSVDFRWDVSGKTGGRTIAPAMSYSTPVSHRQIVGISGGMDFFNEKYMQLNYGISPIGAANSGLPVYLPHGGLRNFSARMFTAYSLSGPLQHGGWYLAGTLGYTHLLGAADHSPLAATGKRGHVLGALAIAYAFRV